MLMLIESVRGAKSSVVLTSSAHIFLNFLMRKELYTPNTLAYIYNKNLAFVGIMALNNSCNFFSLDQKLRQYLYLFCDYLA